MTPCICLGTTHSCNPPHYGLWVNLHFFRICIYKHCFLPMLLVFAMKCCIKMPCPLPNNHYCCSLPSPVCLPHLLICTCLISSPIACPPSSVLCWCLLCFFFIFSIVLIASLYSVVCVYFCLCMTGGYWSFSVSISILDSSVATSWLAWCWMCDSPRTGCAWRITPIFKCGTNKQ